MGTVTAILEASADGTLHLSTADENSRLLEIMERIARRNPFRKITDPVTWQREMREDRLDGVRLRDDTTLEMRLRA